jgi:hypothetical protein
MITTTSASIHHHGNTQYATAKQELRTWKLFSTREQLVAEVKEIYAGLVMVEAKYIDIDNKQAIVLLHRNLPHKSSHISATRHLIELQSMPEEL